ncbi:MAG: hypothetical protein RBJ76_01605 [Stenomitos frigidus ULC029]
MNWFNGTHGFGINISLPPPPSQARPLRSWHPAVTSKASAATKQQSHIKNMGNGFLTALKTSPTQSP